MNIDIQAPSLPAEFGADFSSVSRLGGQLAAFAFLAAIVVMSAQIMMFEPQSGADCVAEICSGVAAR